MGIILIAAGVWFSADSASPYYFVALCMIAVGFLIVILALLMRVYGEGEGVQAP